jgi:hypothetical protein
MKNMPTQCRGFHAITGRHLRMQGNCKSRPSAAALGLTGPELRALTPGQCVLVTDLQLMHVQQNLWLDSLYMRHHTTPRTNTRSLLTCNSKDCNLWLTSVTLQGDSRRLSDRGAVYVTGGQLYAEGVPAAHSQNHS